MYIRHGEFGDAPRSEIILDLVEDAAAGRPEEGGAYGVLLAKVVELHDACTSVARDALLNPTCHDPTFGRLTPKERTERANSVDCYLNAEQAGPEEGKITLRTGCEAECHLRPIAIADPGVLVVDNTYPALIEAFRNRG